MTIPLIPQEAASPADDGPMTSRAAFAGFHYHVQPVPYARLRQELTDLYAYPHRAKKTGSKMRQVLRHLAELLPDDAMTDALTPELVARFIASRPEEESNNTTLSLLRVVSAICNYAMRMGHLQVSPFTIRKSWLRKSRPKFRQHYSLEEIARVLAKAEAEIARKAAHSQAGPGAVFKAWRLYAVVATIAYTGLRKNEGLRLRTEDVDLEARWLHVVDRAGAALKTSGSERSVPIPAPLAKILREWVAHNDRKGPWFFPNSSGDGPWIHGGPGVRPLDRVKALGKRAGVPDLTFLGLRHSFASHAHSAWGYSAEQIARSMGHSNTKMQDYYIHEDAFNLGKKSALVRFSAAGPEDDPADLPAPTVRWAPSAKSAAAPDKPRVHRSNTAKLTDEQALGCRQLRLQGWSYDQLAAKYGMSKGSISYVITGKTYKHVPFPDEARP